MRWFQNIEALCFYVSGGIKKWAIVVSSDAWQGVGANLAQERADDKYHQPLNVAELRLVSNESSDPSLQEKSQDPHF